MDDLSAVNAKLADGWLIWPLDHSMTHHVTYGGVIQAVFKTIPEATAYAADHVDYRGERG